jgi:hypothetical protein
VWLAVNVTRSEALRDRGVLVLDAQLDAATCHRLLDSIRRARTAEAAVEVARVRRGRGLHYEVLDGERVARDMPEVRHLYDKLLRAARELSGLDLSLLSNLQASANVNITAHGGEYRWHYDRNEVTILLYLNEVDGGEIECYPNYRVFLRHRLPRVQRVLDGLLATAMTRRVLGQLVVVAPAPGRMVVMRGDRCLHSVRPVGPGTERVTLVFAYSAAAARSSRKDALDSYLYSQQDVTADPNYQS